MDFHGSEEQLLECITGYTLTEKVVVNVGPRTFERILQDPKPNPPATDPALTSLLQRQADLIHPTEKVNRLSEAPEKHDDKIPPCHFRSFTHIQGYETIHSG